MRVQAIISDSDGTLVDTVRLIEHGQYEALKTYLGQQGLTGESLPSYSDFITALHASIGGSARNTLEKTAKLLFSDRRDILDVFDFDALHDLLNPAQDALAPSYVKPYVGLEELLRYIGETNTSFGIFTSGTKHHVVRNLGIALPQLGLQTLFLDASKTEDAKFDILRTQLQRFFHIPKLVIVTCEVVDAHKPDPASLKYAMQQLSARPAESLVVGDHAVDMQAGVRAGVAHRIGISHGFHAREGLVQAGATQVVRDLRELKRVLQSNA
ncbi:hypothetical protein CSA80_03330 [Candidatus Saccharibacteria bacterium]|nr:MAG: hypothetical protein CSA80_03330 [Candidatus Saccharibacteria bacterium]